VPVQFAGTALRGRAEAGAARPVTAVAAMSKAAVRARRLMVVIPLDGSTEERPEGPYGISVSAF
jgi:hypothetical protein